MKITVAGDFCPQHRVADLFNKGDFPTVLGEVKAALEESDYALVNFECPVCQGEEEPICKFGSNLQCTPSGMEAIKWAGFNCVTLANNHFLDYGSEGVANTLKFCKEIGIDYVGGGMNITEASQILYVGNIAIVNCCEHEFSIASDFTAGSNPLNPIKQYNSIKEARTKADYVLVIVHGGHEHWQLPSTRMRETYRFFIDAGADAVVNHHQHCFSGYEIYNGKPIFYGLGNFCFDKSRKKRDTWYEGYMLQLDFSETICFNIIPYIQCKDKPTVSLLSPTCYNEKIESLNSIIADIDSLKKQLEQYYLTSSKSYLNIFEPLNNRLYLALKHRGLVPSLITTKRILRAMDYVYCEAHRDKLSYLLSNFVKS